MIRKIILFFAAILILFSSHCLSNKESDKLWEKTGENWRKIKQLSCKLTIYSRRTKNWITYNSKDYENNESQEWNKENWGFRVLTINS